MSAPEPCFPGRGLAWLAFAAAALAARTGPLFLPAADTWWHLGQIHAVVRAGGLLPHDADGATAHNAGIWHGLLGQVCRVTGLEPLAVWVLVAPLVAAAWTLALGALARRVLGARWQVAGALAGLFMFEGTHLDPLRELSYPRYANVVVWCLAIAWTADHIEQGRRRHLALAALAGGLLAAVHVVEFALFGVLLACALPAFWLTRRADFRVEALRLVRVGLASLLIAAPFVANVLTPGSADSALALALDREHRLREALRFAPQLYMLDPLGEFGQIYTPAGALALVLVPLWLPSVRRRAGAALVLAGLVGAPLICLDPIAFPLFLRAWPAPEVAHRVALIGLSPFAVLLAVQALRARWADASARGRVALPVLFAFLAAGAWPAVRLRATHALAPAGASELASAAHLASFVRDAGPAFAGGGAVLTDPWTSYHFAGLFGAVPADLGASRAGDLRWNTPAYRFFATRVQTSAELRAFMLARRVQLVVVNRHPEPDSYERSVYRDAYYPPRALELLAANPRALPLVAARDGFAVHRVVTPLPDLAGKDLAPAAARAILAVAAEPWRREVGLAAGLALLAPAAGHEAWTPVRPGTVATQTVRWRFRAPRPAAVSVRIHALHAEAPSALGKPGRKLAEAWTGRTYRFGADVDLVPEAELSLTFEAGDEIEQVLTLPVPANAVPGSYAVQLEPLNKPLPDVRDVVWTDAPLPGLSAGTLAVVP